MPPNRFGFLYPAEGMYRLADVAGLSRATEMLLLGTPVGDAAALACGLVHKVLDVASFEQDLGDICRIVAENAPLSMRGTKETLVRYAHEDLARRAVMDATYARMAECLNSADVAEARAAFREKRAPRFQGR
jgi:enoyl-CoA hydratase/carnithine racemase